MSQIAEITPKSSETAWTQLKGLMDSPEGSKCFQIMRAKLGESYPVGFCHCMVTQDNKIVKNEPKIAENTPKSSKTGLQEFMGLIDSPEVSKCFQIMRTKL